MFCLKYQKFASVFIRSANIYCSSINRIKYNYDRETTLIRQTMEQNKPTTKKKWRELYDKLLVMKNDMSFSSNIETIVMDNCDELESGKSYAKFIREECGQEPSTNTLCRLLHLYYQASKTGKEITVDDQREIYCMLVYRPKARNVCS